MNAATVPDPVSLDTRGRVKREPNWPQGGMVTRPIGDCAYDVQAFTGHSVSNVSEARWGRGQLVRFNTPPLRPSGRELFMYDRSDPVTWNYAGR